MTLRIPNRTAQTGVFKTGSPDYVDVSSGTAVASMVTFSAKAADDSWSDSDTVGIAITKDASNYKVWLSSWDETNEYLELVTEEESVGTISDTDAVTVTAVLTQGTVEGTLNAAANAIEVLTADRTYYVRTDGSDSNDGLADSASGAFLTIQKAVDTVASIDLGGNQVTIQVRSGTYSESVVLKPCRGVSSAKPPLLVGDTSTPSNVIISAATCISALGVSHRWYIGGFKIVSTATGIGCYVGSHFYFPYAMDFGTCTNAHLSVTTTSTAGFGANYTISGGSATHWNIQYGGMVFTEGRTVTITGTPAFPSGFAYVRYAGIINAASMTFSGSATGKRYDIAMNGACNVNGAGTSYLPGNSSGTTATGGQYA